MARRDNQGIQIAMIVFILTTLLFMVGTYLGYSSWAAASSELDQAKKSVTEKEGQMRTASQAADGMKTAIGLDPSLGDDAAKTEADRWVQEVMGAGLPEESRNFLGIVRARDARIADLNSQLAKANADIRDLDSKLKKTEETAAKSVAMARAAEEKAVADLKKERSEFNSTLTSREQSLAKIEADSRAAQAKSAKEAADARKELSLAQGNESQAQQRAKNLQEKLNEIDRDTPDQYDGRVVGVVAATRTVLIDVGRADGIRPKTTFGVYDAEETNVRTAKKKASIEVTRVVSDHRSEARITDADYRHPIVGDDFIYSPIWSRGLRLGVALAGEMDVDQDGRDDKEYIKNLIELNGGQIDAQIVDGKIVGGMTVNTRYIVVGEGSKDAGAAAMNQMIEDAERLTIEKMSVSELMDLMSPPGRSRSVLYGTGAPRPSDFAPVQDETAGRYKSTGQTSFRKRAPTPRRLRVQ